MKITDISVSRPVTVSILYIGIIILSVVSYYFIELDFFPDVEFPIAVVYVEYENVGPKEIENSVTKPLEEAVGSVNNVDYVTSISKEGMSSITIKFQWGTDMVEAVADIRERIDMVRSRLPEGIENPVTVKFDISMLPIMGLAITGERERSYIKKYAEDNIKNLIEQTDGVASAQVVGGEDLEAKVELIKSRMDAYRLSIDQIIQTLALENQNIAGGDIKTAYTKYTFRTEGEFKSLDDMRNIVVAVRNNTPIYLRDIARVSFEPGEVKDIVHINGVNGTVMLIQKQSGKNTVLTVRNVYKKLESIKPTLPAGFDIRPIFDQGEMIQFSIQNLLNNLIQGSIISIAVVLLILRNIRASLLVGLSIPISVITSFVLMYLFDLSLNMMSLGGLAIGVGMVIDNAIVVTDNIFRYREKGARLNEASKLGTDEMGGAITASTITNLVVFVPFMFSAGLAAQLFTDMALTITFSMMSSLFVALTLIPMVIAKFVPTIEHRYTGRSNVLQPLFDKSEKFFIDLENFYGKAINWALDNKKKVIGIVGITFLIGLILIPLSGMEFMPERDDSRITIMATLPIGTNLDETTRIMKLIEERTLPIFKEEELKVVMVRAGYGKGTNAAFNDLTDYKARIQIELKMRKYRERSKAEIRDILRKALQGIPGVTYNFTYQSRGSSSIGMGSEGATISIEVYGYDFEQSNQYVQSITNSIKNIPGLKDIDISREEGLPEKVVVVNREKASKMGINAYQVANLIKNNVAGFVASRYRFEGDEYDINVRLREADRQTVEQIKSLEIDTPMGKRIKIGSIIDVIDKTGPTAIDRKNHERVVYINCKAEGRALSTVAADINSVLNKIPKPQNFYVSIGGSYEDMQDTFNDLLLVLILGGILTYVIMAAQFESLIRPFIVMFSVPTCMFGVSLFMFLTGSQFSVATLLGIIMLVGIVVNNAIVLVDYTDILIQRGRGLREAVVEAGTKRLRPIMMTTLTTVLSLIPMAFSGGDGSEMSQPIGRAVMGGMSTGFIFTLIFIPIIYMIVETRREKHAAKHRAKF